MAKRNPRTDTTSQPHDAFIKYAFSRREHAAGLLAAALHPIADLVDWSTLRLEKDSFMDRALRGRYADLLFSARMGGERLYIYTLVEQQRCVVDLMILRMGIYMVRIWERLVRERPGLKKLPPIVPVLIHHSATGWTAATAFEDVVDIPEPARAAVLPHVPRFQMRVVDLGPERASGLVEEALTAFGKIVLWALSVAGDDERLLKEIDRMSGAIDAAIAAPDGYDALFALLRYLVSTHQRLGGPRIAALLEEKALGGRRQVMTDMTDVFWEFKREGLAEGRAEGRALTLLELLDARFGPVPDAVRERILAAKEPTLARWTLRVLTAPTLQAVLASPARATKKKAPSRAARA